VLHAIVVADIHDSAIGLSVRQDVFQWTWELNRIAEYTELEVVPHLIVDDHFGANKVINEIRDLEVEADDVVLFAYSGHGYRNESKESKWPVMFVDWQKTCLDIATVADEVAQKCPRFALVVADCCNAVYADSEAPTYRGSLPRSVYSNYTKENYRALFCDSTGMLVISASNIGEYAYGYSNGGLYTYNFLSNLRSQAKTVRGLTWDAILTKTYDKVVYKQTPIHEFIEIAPYEEVVQ
jgi:hypothetical protein